MQRFCAGVEVATYAIEVATLKREVSTLRSICADAGITGGTVAKWICLGLLLPQFYADAFLFCPASFGLCSSR